MSVFERLGGEAGVRAFVDELARRTADDPQLGPLFDSIDKTALQEHRERYFAAVLGGPEQYSGRGMRHAHRTLRLTDAHLDRFVDIADESLVAVGASADAIRELRALVEGLRSVIVTPTFPS
jgi:hemoglobin